LLTDGGFCSQRLIDYHEARAKGGVGLIIIEVTTPGLKCQSPGQLTLEPMGIFPVFRRLADAVHQYGTGFVVQLQHSGIEARGGQRIQVAPSPVIVPSTLNVPSG
jgi:2,4-dienoyl-CoA reductase-like NADH-dependent reductase (Old Yellow Enzyme family)